jgi:hypothetical protein
VIDALALMAQEGGMGTFYAIRRSLAETAGAGAALRTRPPHPAANQGGSVHATCEACRDVRLHGPTPDQLIDPHLFPEVHRERDHIEQAECRPPAHEVIEWHLTYIAEAYLPSHVARLTQGLDKANWSEERFEPTRVVPSMRESPGRGGWTNLGILVPKAHWPGFGVRAAPLPDGVASVRIALWSVTSSLTVLVAGFEWDSRWADSLDRIAKTDYESALIPTGGGGHTIYSPALLKELEARRLRRNMHRHLSAWLRDHVPGAFADLDAHHPALDVVTSAWARPFCGDPPVQTYDYREALGLEAQFPIGSSASLPAWRLAFPDRRDPDVLTLAARTVEGFDEKILGIYGGGVSAWGLANHLRNKADSLMCAWASGRLLDRLHAELASGRDRAPTPDESPEAFAKRLSRDVNRILRRGTDAAAFCSDVLERPREWGPLRVLLGVDWVMHYPPLTTFELRDNWTRWITEQARLVRRLGQEQQSNSSTIAQLTGLAMNIRTQNQVRLLTFFAVLFAALTIAIGILQFTRTPTVRLPTTTHRSTVLSRPSGPSARVRLLP